MKEITELTEDDADWVESLVKTLRHARGRHRAGRTGRVPRARAHDLDARRAPIPLPLINLVGAGIGHHLADALGLRWVYVTDKRGQRLALYGDSKKTLAFPSTPSLAGGRGEPGSLPQIRLRDQRRDHADPGRNRQLSAPRVRRSPNPFLWPCTLSPQGAAVLLRAPRSED